jgi:hypothetical protein
LPLKILIIVRAGRESMHHLFSHDCHDFADIAVSTFEDVDWSGPGVKFTHYARGGKFQGISDFFKKHPDLIDIYDYFWCFEDDLEMQPETLATIHALLTRFRFMLAAPALTPDSHFSWTVAMQNEKLLFRGTDFVEIMAPIMSRLFLKAALPYFAENFTSYGYEWLWQRILKEHNSFAAILDSTPVRHGRPLGSGSLYKNRPGQGNIKDDFDDFIIKFNLDPAVNFRNRFAITNEPSPRLLTGDLMVHEMQGGYGGLTSVNPSAASWTIDELLNRFRPTETLKELRNLSGFNLVESATEQDQRPDSAVAPITMVVALRTHVWNADVAAMARRMAHYSMGATFVILADETNATLDTAPFQKISHTNDFSSLGLPNFPTGQVLWYNADYPLYVLRLAFPNALSFAMIEFDVAVNVDLAAIMQQAITENTDLIAYALPDPPVWWTWREWTGTHFANPVRLLLPVLILSGRAIDTLFARRLELAGRKWPETPADWPYCEVFIPSVVAETPGFSIGDISDYANLPHYTFRHPMHLNDPEANTAGNICHPVLDTRTVIQKRLIQDEPEESFEPADLIYDPDSDIRRQLSCMAPEEFIEPLIARIKSKRPHDLHGKFAELVRQLGWPVPLPPRNIALRKPATQSSVNPWMQAATPENDAKLGNDGQIGRNYGFQTALETDPWWQVDLQDEFPVAKIVLFNRVDIEDTGLHISISSSSDNEIWHLRGVKLDDAPFGSRPGEPYIFTFSEPFKARFIRVQLIGKGHLHLDEIEVYQQEGEDIQPIADSGAKLVRAEGAKIPQTLHGPKKLYHTAVVVCARDETDFIEEWITYYKCIGYEHIYLYCNDDDPSPLYAATLPFVTGQSPFVTFVHFKGQGLQYAMYMHFIRNYVDEVSWVSFLDVDEFLNIVDGSTIDNFLTRFDADTDCILFNWRVFGTSGHKSNPPGKVLENYTRCATDVNSYTKFIARAALLKDAKLSIPDLAFGFWHSLYGKLYQDIKVVNVLGSTERHDHYPEDLALQIRQTAILHHYLLRSEDAARRRIARGLKGQFIGQDIWNSSNSWVAEGLQLYNDTEDFGLVNFWRRQAEKVVLTATMPITHGILLSHGRPCTQSSLSAWSRGTTLAEDAGHAVNGTIDGNQKFHTEKEIDPWWQIDLEAARLVHQIVIYNAAFHTQGRLRNLRISTSNNMNHWNEVYVKQDDIPVGSIVDGPLVLNFTTPSRLRYLRITMIGEEFLHLDQVEIFGEPG